MAARYASRPFSSAKAAEEGRHLHVLKNKSFIGKIYKALTKLQIKKALSLIFYRILFYFLKNQILIVGIAPYNKILNKYEKIICRNKSFYFTSQTDWSGNCFLPGTLNNKRKFELLLTKCFKASFCVTERSKKGVENYIDNCMVVNHSINISDYRQRTKCGGVIKFVFIGQYVERKNISLILSWFKKYSDNNVTMTFIGKGDLENNIVNMSKVDPRIKNLGFKSKTYIKNNLCNYDYLILPSEEEPFGIVLLEALASGVPCIVSNAVGPSEIICDDYNGFVFDLNDKESSFDNKMKQAINLNKKERRVLKKQALTSCSKYDCSIVVKKWIKTIRLFN